MGGLELGRALGHEIGGIALTADQDLDGAADGQGQKQADAEDDEGRGVGEPTGQRDRAVATSHQVADPTETGASAVGPSRGNDWVLARMS